MNNIKKIVKKELDKVFLFPRMIFSTIILPGLLIFVMYTVMGLGIQNQDNEAQGHVTMLNVVNMAPSMQKLIDEDENKKVEYKVVTLDEVDEIKTNIKVGTADILVVFEEGFEEKINGTSKPKVEVFYNSVETNSAMSYTRIATYLEQMRQAKLIELKIDANIYNQEITEIYDDKKATGTLLAILLPMLIMIAIFAGCLGIGTDAIAGEKERGTLSTLLMLPIEKRDIIIGKLISTVIITVCTAVATFIGILASLPFSKSIYNIDGNIGYQVTDYLYIAAIMIITATLAAVLMLIISTFAKNIKEATAYGLPVYILAMFTSILTMNSGGKITNVECLIPIYNCTVGLKSIFSYTITFPQFALIMGSSIIYIVLGIMLLLKMFQSEKVLFGK